MNLTFFYSILTVYPPYVYKTKERKKKEIQHHIIYFPVIPKMTQHYTLVFSLFRV
ncbi:hypothetical protein HMPREF3191_00502 [Veillonellaceae bacterium DNF00626]|nr:hypothetical protein HMPREF3191_00502 [Veillonellaceae bacterium DNF00626]